MLACNGATQVRRCRNDRTRRHDRHAPNVTSSTSAAAITASAAVGATAYQYNADTAARLLPTRYAHTAARGRWWRPGIFPDLVNALSPRENQPRLLICPPCHIPPDSHRKYATMLPRSTDPRPTLYMRPCQMKAHANSHSAAMAARISRKPLNGHHRWPGACHRLV